MGSIAKKHIWLKNLYSVFIFSILKFRFEYKKMKTHFQYFHFHRKQIQWKFCKYCKSTKSLTWLMWVSGKSNLKKKNAKPGMMYFISKLRIQNNLPNTLKCKNESFFLHSILKFEYTKEKMKSEYTTFRTNFVSSIICLIAQWEDDLTFYKGRTTFKASPSQIMRLHLNSAALVVVTLVALAYAFCWSWSYVNYVLTKVIISSFLVFYRSLLSKLSPYWWLHQSLLSGFQ